MANSFLKVRNGLSLTSQSGVPSSPASGDIYYDSTANTFIFYQNGSWINLSSRVDIPSAANLTSSTLTAAVVQNSLIRITGTTATTVHGLAAPMFAKQVIVYNETNTSVTFNYQSLTEPTAANRITTSTLAPVIITNGQTATLFYDDAAMTWVVATTSGTGSSGSGIGDDLGTLQYEADVNELFAFNPTSAASQSTVDTTQTTATFNSANNYMTMSYDASKTVTGSSTSMHLSAAPSYTVAIGDTLRVGTQAKKITALGSINIDGGTGASFTIESAFLTNPTAAAATVSQTVYSKDLNNFAFNGVAISAIYTGSTISECLITYNDTSSGTLYNYTDPALIGYIASADGSAYTFVQSREANPSLSLNVTGLPSTGSHMYVRFFSAASSGSGVVNLTNYKTFFHRLAQNESGGIQFQALCRTDGAGSPVGCSNPTVVGGKTQIVLTNSYPVGVNPGYANGGIRVYLNGQKIPRFIDSTLTADASYTEVNANTIQLDQDYSVFSYEVEIYQDIAVIDTNTQNTTNIASINSHQFQNSLINGAFDFWQRGTSVTVSTGTQTYQADRWFVNNSSGANATYSQVSGTVNGSKFGASVTFGAAAASNNLFLTQVVENPNSLQFLGNTASFGVWIKGLNNTNQVTVSIGYATTETKTQTTILSQTVTVNTSGFTFCSVLAASIAALPTTSGTISVTIQPTGASSGSVFASGNGFVAEQGMLDIGSIVAPFSRAGKNAQEELATCQRYYEKSYDVGVTPGTVTNNGQRSMYLTNIASATHGGYINCSYKAVKRASPIVTSYSPTSGSSGFIHDSAQGADLIATFPDSGTTGVNISATQTSVQVTVAFVAQFTADAEI
jgi:hypothetical protein